MTFNVLLLIRYAVFAAFALADASFAMTYLNASVANASGCGARRTAPHRTEVCRTVTLTPHARRSHLGRDILSKTPQNAQKPALRAGHPEPGLRLPQG